MAVYLEPDWDAPLDVDAHMRAVPRGSVIKGMFIQAMLAEAKRRDLVLSRSSDKFLPFLDYPLVDHMVLLVEAARAFYPELTLRRGLRKIGRAAMMTFQESTIGRTVLAGLTQPDAVAHAMGALARSYAIAINKPAPRLDVTDVEGAQCVLRMTDFWIFLDSHQIGIIEGLLKLCGVRGEIKVAMTGPASGDFACTWHEAGPISSGF